MSRRPDAEEAAHLQYETEHASPSQGKSVIPYMIILVAVAFLLLIVAYFTQQRAAQSVQQGLDQSVNSFRTIDQLVGDNRTLHEQVAQLQEELKSSETRRLELEGQLAQLQQELTLAQEQLAVFLPTPEGSAPPSSQP